MRLSLPPTKPPMQRAFLRCTREEVNAARQAMLEERELACRQMGVVLIECPVCQSTLMAETPEGAYQSLADHLTEWHTPEAAS
jgi:hypothetical protein